MKCLDEFDGKILIQYLKTKRSGALKGVVVVIDKGVYGWSLCTKGERFNKELGLQIAIGRAKKMQQFGFNPEDKVADSVVKLIQTMLFRADYYFSKNDNNQGS